MDKVFIYFQAYARIAGLIQKRFGPLGKDVMPLAVACTTDIGDTFVANVITAITGSVPSEELVQYVTGRLRRWLPRPVADPDEFRFSDDFQRTTLRIGQVGDLPRLIIDGSGAPWVFNEKTGFGYVRCARR